MVDDILQRKLKLKGAVLIQGVKWIRKTTATKQMAKSLIDMTEENNKQLTVLDPVNLLDKLPPILIDEWQLIPSLWDRVRNEVDRRGEKGQFILTCSATPVDKSRYSHSDVGRITRMTMRPMTLYESGDSSGEVSLSSLFTPDCKVFSDADVNIKIAYLIARGEWPETIGQSEHDALEVARDYVDGIIESDLDKARDKTTDKSITRALLISYARNIGTLI